MESKGSLETEIETLARRKLSEINSSSSAEEVDTAIGVYLRMKI